MERTTGQAGEPFELVSGSVEETQAIGERLGRALRAGDVVALSGELGSGKTVLVQGIARGTGRNPDVVKSPTFVLQREYPGEVPLVHIDGYRLENAREAVWLDLEPMFSPHKITVIEWAQRFEGLLPEARLEVRLSHVSAKRRRLAFHPATPRAEAMLSEIRGSETKEHHEATG